MTVENLDQFRQLVLQDARLQESLRTTPDRESFLALLVQLGHAHGYSFTADEVRVALQANRRAWNEH